MTLSKILCPIDFSPGSRQATRTAIRIANQYDAELVLLHSWYVPRTSLTGEYAPEMLRSLADDAQRGLETAVGEARELGARRIAAQLLSGPPWQQIVDAAQRDAGVGLIVIGTHGRTGLSRMLMGSVAELVVRHAPCSVLTVHPGDEPVPYQRVLCPVDLSAHSQDAVDVAAELVQPGGGGISLLHVLEVYASYLGELPVSGVDGDLNARAVAALDRWTTDLETKARVPVAQLVRTGRPAAQILALLDDDRTFDLVVMASHGHTGIARLLLGSVAESVVRHARRPVLVARRRAP